MSHQGKNDPADNSSPESESNRAAGSSGSSQRKRPSRAGTRSVSTLSTSQLERKRANDREAQRAIRQRTKEHIENLERKIAELTNNDEPNEQLVAALKRNKELEEENAILRVKLEQASYSLGMGEGSGRSGSTWDDTVVSRHQPPGQGMPIMGQQQAAPLMTSGRTGSPRPNPFAMGHASQWQPANPYPASASVKSEAASSPGGDVQSEDYSNWAMERRRYGSGASQSSVHQSGYGHVYNAPQTAVQRTGSPLSYQPVQEGHPQPIQQSHGGPVMGSNVPMSEYGVHGTGQSHLPHQHPHQQQQQQQRQPQQRQYREQRTQGGQVQQQDHPSQQVYYGSYSQG